MKPRAQGGFVVFGANPVEKRYAAFGGGGVVQEESVEDAGAGAVEVAEAPGELVQGLGRRAAFEQDGQAGGQAGAVGAGFAVHQGGGLQGFVEAGEAQDAVAVGGAAAFEGHVDVGEAEAVGGFAGEGVAAALAVAAQVDQGFEAVFAGGGFEARGGGVVGAVEFTGDHFGPVVPQHAEDGVVDEEGVGPGVQAGAAGF